MINCNLLIQNIIIRLEVCTIIRNGSVLVNTANVFDIGLRGSEEGGEHTSR